MTEPLSTLLRDTASRVPAALHPAADLRRHAEHHRRVRRAGAAASLTVVLVIGLLGFNTQGGGRKAAPPAERPPLSHSSLLIPAELPDWGQFSWKETASGDGEGASPVTSCQQGSLGDLRASETWHASYAFRDLGARQVVARFSGAQEAASAFDAVDSWFDGCSGVETARLGRWPPLDTAGGRARTVSFSRPVGPDESRFEFVSFGVEKDALTIVSFAMNGQDANFTSDPLATTVRFALHRLAGDRTTRANAAAEFRFAEERTDPTWQAAGDEERSTALAQEWLGSPCIRETVTRGPLPSDALRTGMVTAQRVELVGGPTRQLALYPDAETARSVARELEAEFTACASTVNGITRTTWTLQRETGRPGVALAWSTNVDDPAFGPPMTQAVAIAARGNAVLLSSAYYNVEAGPDSRAVSAVLAATEANLAVVCEVADCR